MVATTLEKKLLAEELKREGFVIRDLGNWPLTATYFKPDGEALPNLPADPYSMQKYRRRGLSLVPPVMVAPLYESPNPKVRKKKKSRRSQTTGGN